MHAEAHIECHLYELACHDRHLEIQDLKRFRRDKLELQKTKRIPVKLTAMSTKTIIFITNNQIFILLFY
jgi:hypothetical protein